MSERRCGYRRCGAILVRPSGESARKFAMRKFCSLTCRKREEAIRNRELREGVWACRQRGMTYAAIGKQLGITEIRAQTIISEMNAASRKEPKAKLKGEAISPKATASARPARLEALRRQLPECELALISRRGGLDGV